MAVYTTQAQLEKRVGKVELAKLADYSDDALIRDETAATTQLALAGPIAVIAQAIADGAAEIDSYVLGHLDMSDSVNQASLERINAGLALFNLYRNKHGAGTENKYFDSAAADRAWLRDVSKRVLHTQSNVPTSRNRSTRTSDNQVFTADEMENF